MWDFVALGPELWGEPHGGVTNAASAALGVGPSQPLPLRMCTGHSLALWPQFPYQDNLRTLQLGKPLLQRRLLQRVRLGVDMRAQGPGMARLTAAWGRRGS